MKKVVLMLHIVVMLLCGCDGPVIPPSTEPPVVQIPETTEPATQPPETNPPDTTISPTTEPVETTVELTHPLHDEFVAAGYESYVLDEPDTSVMYRYIGDNATLYVPGLDITLELPENQMSKIEVIALSDDMAENEFRVYVITKNIIDAGCEVHGRHVEGHRCEFQSTLHNFVVYRREKENTEDTWETVSQGQMQQLHPQVFLGETDEYFYFMNSPYFKYEDKGSNVYSAAICWKELQEYYSAEQFADLRDEFYITTELVQEMVTIPNSAK